jgi:hypothetical protein
MLYNDRKMLKWQGFLLSEHVEQLKKLKIEKKNVTYDEQAKELFDRVLHTSIQTGKEVVLEMDTFGEPYLEVKGVVKSFTRTGRKDGYIKLEGYSSNFWMDEIVSIDFAESDECGDVD